MTQQWIVESIDDVAALEIRLNELRAAGTGVDKILFNPNTNKYTVMYLDGI